MDRYSPLAPAFVRVLLLPVGQIERKRFLRLLDALKHEASVVRLGDVEPLVGDDELLLSPQAFPQGCLLYNYSTSVPSEHHHQLSPYQLFREPMLVIGVVDGLGEGAASGLEELGEASRYLREKHQRVVDRQLLVVDKDGGSASAGKADDAVHVPESALKDTSLLKDAVLNVSARFLSELSTYTRALQASPSIQTPGHTARSLQRSASTREYEKAPPSGRSTPTHASEAGSPVKSSGVKTPPYGRSSPATSFDQIATHAQNALPRSESRASRVRNGARASSQDRAPASGFGSLSKEKLKNRGKARVSIVTGHLYMMAGQWAEALKILVQGTHSARTLSDFLWHAKGMEGVVVCLLLHAWGGVEFQIPTLCYPLGDRVTSGHSQRFSINLPSDFRTSEAAQKAALHKLSGFLPDLLKQILNLYDSGEASLELPFLVISEATVRCCKLLLLLQQNGELSQEALRPLTGGPDSHSSAPVRPVGIAPKVSSSAIATMLAEAQPVGDEGVPLPDQVSVLAGVASVYASLGMKRKRAAAMREMVVKLTQGLSQARKRGAAEAGIHPAATLSSENGAEAILAAMELSGGLHQMLEDVAGCYGVSLDTETDAVGALLADASGSDTLKQLVLTELSAFCEVSPDLQGLLRVNSALLKATNSRGVAGDEVPNRKGLSREEQIRLTATISRSVGVSKHLGLPKLEAKYWDPFLVRDVIFTPLNKDHTVVERSSLKSGAGQAAQEKSANPLLYDPNASRPGTRADSKPQPATLVQGEAAECLVKLQNPHEVPVEVESISLVADGAELVINEQSFTLGPLRIQDVPLSVNPISVGECNITACRVKISGCEEQDFPIYRKPWVAPTPLLIKNIGQEAGVLPVDRPTPPPRETVTATVIDAQPLLVLENTSLVEEGLMLLDGESIEVDFSLMNVSNTAAALVDFVSTSDILSLGEEALGTSIPPGESKTLKLLLHGKAGVSHIRTTFLYGRAGGSSNEAEHVRVLSVPMDVTVNASLQLQNLDIIPLGKDDTDELTLSLDVGNAWPKSLGFECSVAHDSKQGHRRDSTKAQGTLAPGQIQRIFLSLQRPELPQNASTDTLREALLKMLHGTWTGDGRHGEIDFSKLRPSAETLEVLRNEPIALHLSLLGSEHLFSPDLKAGSFITVRARIVNNGASTMPLLVNLQPRALEPGDAGVEERRFAVAGAQHRILPPLAVGKEVEIDFAVCPLLAGSLEVEGFVRVARMGREVKGDGEGWVVRRGLGVRVV